MYPTLMVEDGAHSLGYVIIDSGRDGCFPLVIRPLTFTYFNGKRNKPRSDGLGQTMDDLEKKRSEVLSIINTDDEWEEIEPKLEKIFNYPKPSNDVSYTSNTKTG